MGSKPLEAAKAQELQLLERVFELLLQQPPFDAWTRHSEAANPLVILARIKERSLSLALRGLRAAISDLLEASEDLPVVEVARLDAVLRAAGAPTLTELRQKRTKKVRAILRSGGVTNADECRLLASVLGDLECTWLTPAMRELAERIMATYDGPSE